MTMEKFKVPVSMLTPVIDAGQLGFKDTGELEPLTEIIGQERAVEALEFGLNMKGPGFNLYVSGPVGTGKGTLVRQMVTRMALAAPTPPDWCYVNNFQDSSRPTSLALPAGQGASFKREMAAFIEGLRRDIPMAFESKKYLDAKAKLHDDIDAKKKVLFHELTEHSRTRGFGFEETSVGFGIVPLKAGKSMTAADIEAMTEDEQRDLNERRKRLEGEIRDFHVHIHGLEKEAEHQQRHLDRQLVMNVLEGRYETMRRTYQDMTAIATFLERVWDDIVRHYKDFLPREGPPLPFQAWNSNDRTRRAFSSISSYSTTRRQAPPSSTNLIRPIRI
ncbi:MAG: hypothetical protein CV088_13905 [Nitrospira sp. LK70]|nr:hypothetical protein [Nitrospira sp. LK70]